MNSIIDNATEVPSSLTASLKKKDVDLSTIKTSLQDIAKKMDCTEYFNIGALFGTIPNIQSIISAILEGYKHSITSVEQKADISTFNKALDTLFHYSKIVVEEQKLIAILSGYISSYYEKSK